MGIFDAISLTCPACNKSFMYRSKWGPGLLKAYTLEDAPLAVIADLNDEGKKGSLFCQHCGVPLEVSVKFSVFIRSNGYTQELLEREV